MQMNFIEMDRTECVICLQTIVESQKEEESLNLEILEKSLLKLLQVGKIPVDTCNDSSHVLFCRNCLTRNFQIFTTFTQIEELGRVLEDLKVKIEDDFRKSELILKERGPSGEIANDQLDLRKSLRRCISTSLLVESIPTEVSEAGAALEEDWFDNSADETYELSESRQENPDPYGYLKKVYEIKDCTVKVDRLPRKYIDQFDISDTGLSSSVGIDHSSQKLKCVFADCPWNIIFKTEAARKEHIESVHGNLVPLKNPLRSNPFKCVVPGCKASFNQRLKRYLHLRKVHRNVRWKKLLVKENAKPSFRCIFADCRVGAFHSEEERDAHVDGEHGSVIEQNPDVEKFKCIFADCDLQSFDSQETRDEHVKTVHKDFRELSAKKECKRGTEGGVGPTVPRMKYFCQVQDCKRKRGFLTEGELDLHRRVYHEGLKKSYQCKECGKYFSKKNLWAHVQVVHLNIRKFICHFCGYACSASPDLRRHLVTHTNERNYKCEICEKTFKTPEGVKVHTRYAHTGERPYRCDRCGKGFVTQGHLGKHLKCVHNKDVRPHICEICGKTFPIHGYLHEHMKNSHGDNPRRRNQNRKKVATIPKIRKIDSQVFSNPIIPAVALNAEESSNSYPTEDAPEIDNSVGYIPSGNFPVNLSFYDERLHGSSGVAPQFPGMSSSAISCSISNFKPPISYFQSMGLPH